MPRTRDGGVDGHQLKLVAEDDQSSPTVNNTAGEDLVTNKGAFGIIDFSRSPSAAPSTSSSRGSR